MTRPRAATVRLLLDKTPTPPDSLLSQVALTKRPGLAVHLLVDVIRGLADRAAPNAR